MSKYENFADISEIEGYCTIQTLTAFKKSFMKSNCLNTEFSLVRIWDTFHSVCSVCLKSNF